MNSKQKGSAAEREVAKICQVWWQRIEPGCEFVRTPLSGGWSTPKLRGEFKAAGDLMTTARRWPFTTEIKRREAWSMRPLVAGRTSPVWAWWGQVLTAAAEEDRRPLLWFRHNREPWLVMVHDAVTKGLGLEPVIEWPDLLALNVPGALPVVYRAADLIQVDPERCALAPF